jgi:hypothetical protein
MLFIILCINIINIVSGDLIMEPNYDENDVPIDNIIASSLWALSVCSCVGIVCNHKKKIPIKIQPKEEYGKQLYEISVKNPDELNKLKSDLQDMKTIIRNIEYKYNQKSKQHDIPEDIIYKFGEGPIRFKKDGKYYHGIDPNYKPSWSKEYIGCMWHYKNPNTKLPHPEWDTHTIEGFCSNCSYENDRNKKKKSRFVYKCNGHEIN